MSQQALAVYQNFPYSFWSKWKIFLCSFLNPHTVYKTAPLNVFYWLLDVPSVAFLRRSCLILSRRAHTHAVRVKYILYWKKNVARTSNCVVAECARSQQLFYHRNNSVTSARLALNIKYIEITHTFLAPLHILAGSIFPRSSQQTTTCRLMHQHYLAQPVSLILSTWSHTSNTIAVSYQEGIWTLRTFTAACKLSPSWATQVQFMPHYTSWRSILILSFHLYLGLSCGLLPSNFPIKHSMQLLPPQSYLHASYNSLFLIWQRE